MIILYIIISAVVSGLFG